MMEERLSTLEKQVSDIHNAIWEISKILKKFETVSAAPAIVDIPPAEPEKEPETIVDIPPAEPEPENPLIKLLHSNEWPEAVNPADILDINDEQDKEDRAEGILEMIIDVHMENLKFLDFGCGEGHVVNKSKKQNTKLSVGYDIKKSDRWDSWEKGGNVIYTTDWNIVKNSGPYNVVLMYDVIDHMISTHLELQTKLKEIKSILAPNGKVYVRCHPWSSRHGTHLYRQINKAFVHMLFTDDEIKKMGYTQEKVRQIKHPATDYAALWTSCGFRATSGPHHSKSEVEPFFKNNPEVKAKIQDCYKDSIWEVLRSGAVFPEEHMSSNFIDWTLS